MSLESQLIQKFSILRIIIIIRSRRRVRHALVFLVESRERAHAKQRWQPR